MWNTLWNHRRALLLVTLMVSVMLVPTLVLAQSQQASPSQASAPITSPKTDDIADTIMSFANLMQSLLQRILWPVLLLIGGLLKNDILFGAGMEDRLLAVWGVIRNLVNIAFVLVLLGIAFYNVMGLGQNYHLKTKLPVFIIALIAVNFSFLGVKVVLDSINVVSTAIFALPYSVTQNQGVIPEQGDYAKKICQGIHGYTKAEYEKSVTDWGDSALCNKDNASFTQKGEEFFTRWDGRNAAVALAVNLANSTELQKVFPNQKITITNLMLNNLFSLIFYIIYAVAFVALFIVLVVRLVVLWLGLVLSPLMVLPYVLPESIKGALGEGNSLREQFVQNAIAPIPIAVVMTIGFILLQHFKTANFGSLTFSGTTLGANLLISGLTTLQELIANVAMVIFLWKGIFAAAEKTAAKEIIGKIKGGVEAAGKFVGTSWQYIPAFPVAVGDGTEPPQKVSLAATLGMMNQMQNVREQRVTDEAASLYKQMTGKDAVLAANDIKKAKDVKGLREYLKKHENHMNSKDAQKALAEMFERNKSWKDHKDLKTLPTSLNVSNMDEFIKKLKEGEVNPAGMKDYIEENTKGVSVPTPPPGQQPAGQPQTPGQQPLAINKAKAKEIMEAADGKNYAQILTPDEQKILDNLAKPAKGKEDEALQKAQGVLQKIENAQNEAFSFRSELASKSSTGTAQEIEQMVNERKNKVKADFNLQNGEENGVVKAEIMKDQPLVDKLKAMQDKGLDISNVGGLDLSH